MTLSLLLIIMDDSSTFFVTLSLLLIIMDGSIAGRLHLDSLEEGGPLTKKERQAYLSHAYRSVDRPTLVMPTCQ